MNIVEPEPETIDAIRATVGRLRASFETGRTRPLKYRQEQLAGLDRLLGDCEREVCQILTVAKATQTQAYRSLFARFAVDRNLGPIREFAADVELLSVERESPSFRWFA